MSRLTPSKLKDLLFGSVLTAGFTLISSGVGIICGSLAGPVVGTGTGLTVGGVGLVVLQQWWANSGG